MALFGQVFPIAEDRSVDLPSIERELRRLWQGTADARTDEDAAVTRVCTLNLVALAPDARSAARASEAGAAITSRYPCRVIIATADRAGCDGMEASVSAYGHVAGASSKPICCERISLYASGKTIHQLALAITPLLAPDVPVFVWLQGDPDAFEELYRRLVRIADRLVVDLQSASKPDRVLASIVSHIQAGRPSATDLAWRRTAHWREIVASFFDPPNFRVELPLRRAVEITYSEGGVGWPQAQAALVGAWIAERLGWTPKGRFKRDGGAWALQAELRKEPCKVSLVPSSAPGVPPGDLVSIVFPAPGAEGTSFVAQRAKGDCVVDLRIVRPNSADLSWRHPVESIDTAWLLGQELERPHGSVAFEQVAQFLNTVL